MDFAIAAGESKWLRALSEHEINTTVVWGLHDNVSPVRMANFVWESFLKGKPGRNRHWSCQPQITTFNAMLRGNWRKSFD